MLVLIAEDDAVSRMILTAAVENAGHETIVAEDGEGAWDAFLANPGVDVVISDWMMPGIDGLELCRRIRGHESDLERYIYFIFLTALADRDHLQTASDAGADDFLTKPLNRGELSLRLASAARVNALHRRLNEQARTLENLNEQLRHQSRRDPLTGLGNRLRLTEDLQSLTARAERYGHGYCVVLCDIDGFKPYNDHYGHQAGDAVLRKLGDAIAGHCRTTDTAYRYGGEEFLILLPEQELDAGLVFAERLRQMVEDLALPHRANTDNPIVTISVGVAASPGGPGGSDPSAVIAMADLALYQAKADGRNRVVSLDEPAAQH